MGTHVMWFDLSIPIEDFAREVAPDLRDQLQRDVVKGHRQMNWLLQLEETRPQQAQFFRQRIDVLRESIRAMEESVAEYSRLIRQHTTTSHVFSTGTRTVAAGSYVPPPSSTIQAQQAVSTAASNGRLAQLLQGGRAIGAAAWQGIKNGWHGFTGTLGAAWAAVQGLGIRGAVVAVVRGLPGGVPGVVGSLLVVALAGGGYYYVYVREPAAVAPAGGMPGAMGFEALIIDAQGGLVLQAFFGFDDTVTLLEGQTLLAGPADHFTVNQQMCEKLDPGSLRVLENGWAEATFRGIAVSLGPLDLARLQDCRR